MTTSVLSAGAGELSKYDLQVVKDYALNAPWEWRKVLTALIEHVEDSDLRYEKLRATLFELIEAGEATTGDIRDQIKDNPRNLVITLPAFLEKLDIVTSKAEAMYRKP